MTDVFLSILNMSITASWIVLAVMVVRLLFPKAPKWIHCLLWGFVALRLVLPFFFESSLSLIPSAQVIPLDITTSQTPAIYSGIPAVNSAVNPQLTLHPPVEEGWLDSLLWLASRVWLGGVGALLLYSIVSSLRLRWRIRVSLRKQDNVYFCDQIDSPFVFGILRPRIYLPSSIGPEQIDYVLSHENAHIQRRDHWWKPFGFLLLTVYWFNPLFWLAYVLLCRDIERACDEKVIAGMDAWDKKGYSLALLECSVHRRLITACPIAFGEVSVKTRIKGVLNYRQPGFWTLLVSAVLCAVVVVCFLTNPNRCRHDYIGQITIPATCTKKGMQTLTCGECEHCYTRSVPQIAHSYDAGTITTAPTCVSRGIRTFQCTGCDAQKTETVAKTAHIAGEPIAIQEPNCTETGQKTATCTYCRVVFVIEELASNDVHELYEEVLREPTCADPGEGAYKCTRCDYQESCTYPDRQPAHQYTSWLVSESTCSQYGVQRHSCIFCGDAYDTYLPKSDNHNWQRVDHEISKCRDCSCIDWGIDDYDFFGGTSGNRPSGPTFPVVSIYDPVPKP